MVREAVERQWPVADADRTSGAGNALRSDGSCPAGAAALRAGVPDSSGAGTKPHAGAAAATAGGAERGVESLRNGSAASNCAAASDQAGRASVAAQPRTRLRLSVGSAAALPTREREAAEARAARSATSIEAARTAPADDRTVVLRRTMELAPLRRDFLCSTDYENLWLPICDIPQKFPAPCARCVWLRITGTICPKASPANRVTCIMLPQFGGAGGRCRTWWKGRLS